MINYRTEVNAILTHNFKAGESKEEFEIEGTKYGGRSNQTTSRGKHL
jgi:hypothetical protein